MHLQEPESESSADINWYAGLVQNQILQVVVRQVTQIIVKFLSIGVVRFFNLTLSKQNHFSVSID